MDTDELARMVSRYRKNLLGSHTRSVSYPLGEEWHQTFYLGQTGASSPLLYSILYWDGAVVLRCFVNGRLVDIERAQ